MDKPVKHQVNAFNKRDIDSFLEAYAPEIEIENGNGETLMNGLDEVRDFYENVFENSPDLHCDIINRTHVGNWVIDEEQVHGLNAEGFPDEAHAIVSYKVEDNFITLARMYL